MGAQTGAQPSASKSPDAFKSLPALMEKHYLRRPLIPGDILVSGDLPREVVGELAGGCKGWLYLNPETDPSFFGDVIRQTAQLEVMPFKPGKDVSADLVSALADKVRTLPRPLMIQCSTANRAVIAMFLWLAEDRGYTGASLETLANDLKLDTLKAEALKWLTSYLPRLGEKDAPLSLQSPEVRQLFDGESSTLTYLISCPETKEAVLIDPVLEQKQRDLQQVQSLGLRLKYVLNTHCHADHITSGGAIRKELPEVRTMISESSGAKADIHVKHGDVIKCGSLTFEVRATPGHTDGCVCFILRTSKNTFAFTGDTVLIRGCGRTDFQQGNAKLLHENVHRQLFTLPGSTLICPGHDYKGRSVSTVEEEKLFNPRLSKSADEFEKIMAALGLPYPAKIDAALPANMTCGVQDEPDETSTATGSTH